MKGSKKLRYKIKIKDFPLEERPRERLIKLGPDSLSNAELLSAIIGTGSKKENALILSNRLLVKHSLREFSQISVSELKKTFGINDAKACKIIAAFELGKRAITYNSKLKPLIRSPEDISDLFMPGMRNLKKEILKCVYLNSKYRILKYETIAMGGLNSSNVHPREIFGTAISEAAAGIILIHNHPSGDPSPSANDIHLTKKIRKAGKLIGIEVLDHIIIGNGKYVSLKESNSF